MQLPIPGVGDVVNLFVEWRKARRESNDRTLVLLQKISEELDALASHWVTIAIILRKGSPTSSITDELLVQRNHFEALRSFRETIQSDVKSNNYSSNFDTGKDLVRILDDALDEKGHLYFLAKKVILPGYTGIEASSAVYDPDTVRGRTPEYYLSLDPSDENLDPSDRVLARRARWAKKELENELIAQRNEEAKISEGALAEIISATEQLSGFAGEFRAAVAIFGSK